MTFHSGTPSSRQSVARSGSPGFDHNCTVARAAREDPGTWVDLATGRTRGAAHAAAWRVRHQPSPPFRPLGAYEARTERRDNGYAVQVRYVGGPP